MRLFLQINICDWKDLSYQTPLTGYASSLSDDIIGTDLDYQSEPYVADLVLKLAVQAEVIFLYVMAPDNTLPLGTSLNVFNQLLRSKEKIQKAILSGEHAMADKMLRPLRDKFIIYNDEEAVKTMIRQFALEKS
jgi:hypothetical protein